MCAWWSLRAFCLHPEKSSGIATRIHCVLSNLLGINKCVVINGRASGNLAFTAMSEDRWGQLTLVLQIFSRFSASHAIIVIVSTTFSPWVHSQAVERRKRINWTRLSSRTTSFGSPTDRLSLSLNVALFLLPPNSAKSSAQAAGRAVTKQAGLIEAICGCGAVLQCQRHLKYYPERFFLPVSARRTFFRNRRRFRVRKHLRLAVGLVVDSGIQVFLMSCSFSYQIGNFTYADLLQFSVSCFLHAFCAAHYEPFNSPLIEIS